MDSSSSVLQKGWLLVSCDLCGGKETRTLWDIVDTVAGNGNRLKVVECVHCGMVYVNPRPVDMSPYYDPEYTAYHPISGIKRFIKKFLLWQEVRSFNAILPKSPRVLDVGTGGGEDVDFFNSAGWQAKGTDAMTEAAIQAKRELGVDILIGTLEDLKLPDSSYDLVRMKFSLSHVDSPAQTLKEVHRILKTNGIFSVWVPNFDSWGRRMFKKYWVGGEPLRGQLWNFSEDTLLKYLTGNNFKIEKVIHSIVPNTFIHSWNSRLSDGGRGVRLGFNVFSLLIFLPLSILAALVKKSDRIIVRARKL